MRKIILITGASGFIGSHLLDYLEKNLNNDCLIRILVPPWENLSNIRSGNIEICVGDIRKVKDCVLACKDVSYIYHLAALVMDPKHSSEDYYRTNVVGTKNILNSIDKMFEKIVFFSSVGIYGLPSEFGDIEDWNEDRNIYTDEPYGKSKFLGESLIKDFAKLKKFKYSILRPTTVYGPRDKKALLDLVRVIKKGMFFVIGDGENKLDYIYVKDVARAAFIAMNSKLSGEYIIGNFKVNSLNKIYKIIVKSIGNKVNLVKINPVIAYLVSYFFEICFRLFRVKPLIYPKRVKAMTSNFYFDVSRARKELGFVPRVSFKKGFEFTKSWICDNNLL